MQTANKRGFLLQTLFLPAFTVNTLSRSTLPNDALCKEAIEMLLYSDNVHMCSQTLLRSYSLSGKTYLLSVSDEHRD